MALNNNVFEISVGCRVSKPKCQREERNWEGSPSTPVFVAVSEQFSGSALKPHWCFAEGLFTC